MSFGRAFQINKVNRLISTNGEIFNFKRRKRNEFNEFTDEEQTVQIKGIFHQTNSYVSQTGMEAGLIRSKPQPLVMCLKEEAEKIMKDDILEYKGKQYKVIDKTNLVELDICVDISLDVIQDGR